ERGCLMAITQCHQLGTLTSTTARNFRHAGWVMAWGSQSEVWWGWRQNGQRGSQRVRKSAMASLAVTKESSKWRSGRDAERVVGTGAFFRGGESAGAFRADKSLAAEHDRHVVMLTGVGPALEVI